MIPKLSAPLTKLIRTGEGIVLFAFNTVAAVAVIVQDVAPTQAIKYAAIFNAVAFASRTFLKAVAVGKPIVGEPIALTGTLVSGVDQVLSEISATTAQAAAVQAQPGAAPETLASALAPSSASVSSAAP
jgi:hypothetical protein